MELIESFCTLLQHFAPVFTDPTFQTFVIIVTGWILSHAIATSPRSSSPAATSGDGHWSRFHRFFSHAAWDLDTFSMRLAKLVVTILAPGATILWAVDDTLCRKRGLTLYGAGMHYDPLISSRAKALVSWGHDWVVLCLIVVNPFWAPTKVFALPIAMRLYRNRQGLTKGKEEGQRVRRNPPSPSTIRIIALDRNWPWNSSIWPPSGFPTTRSSSPATAPTAARAFCLTCRPTFISSAMSIPKARSTNRRLPKKERTKGPARKKGKALARHEGVGRGSQTNPGRNSSSTSSGCTPPWRSRRPKPSTTRREGPPLTIVLVRDLEGKRPEQMFYCTKLDWTAEQILSAYAYRWAIECTFENCKQFLGLEDPANRLPKAVERTAPMALFLYTLVVVWFHHSRVINCSAFPSAPGTPRRKNRHSPTC